MSAVLDKPTARAKAAPAAAAPAHAEPTHQSSAAVRPLAALDPVISAFHTTWRGDLIGKKAKAQLDRYNTPMAMANLGEDVSERRAMMAADWLVRTVAPTWLDFLSTPVVSAPARDVRAYAAALRARPPITCAADLDDALAEVNEAAKVCHDTVVALENQLAPTISAALMDWEAKRLEEGILTEVVRTEGAHALYAAANAARGPGGALMGDIFSTPFHSAIECVMTISRNVSTIECTGLAISAVVSSRHATSCTPELSVSFEAARKVSALVLAKTSDKLKASAHELFTAMIGFGLEELCSPPRPAAPPPVAPQPSARFQTSLEEMNVPGLPSEKEQESALVLNPNASLAVVVAAAQARMQTLVCSIHAWRLVEDEHSLLSICEVLGLMEPFAEEVEMLIDAAAARLAKDQARARGLP